MALTKMLDLMTRKGKETVQKLSKDTIKRQLGSPCKDPNSPVETISRSQIKGAQVLFHFTEASSKTLWTV
jgi:hypothetical protein